MNEGLTGPSAPLGEDQGRGRLFGLSGGLRPTLVASDQQAADHRTHEVLEDGHHGSTAAAVPGLRADRGGVLALDQGRHAQGLGDAVAEHVSEVGVGAGERQGEVEQPPLSAPPPVRAVLHLARPVQRGWAVRPRLTLRGVLRSA